MLNKSFICLILLWIAVMVYPVSLWTQDRSEGSRSQQEYVQADSLAAVVEEEAPTPFPLGYRTKLEADSIIATIPKDTSSQAEWKRFDGSLQEKYKADDALDYERNVGKSFFQRLKDWVSSWLDKLFGGADVSGVNSLSERIIDVLLIVILLIALYIVIRILMNHRARWFFEKKNEAVAVDLSNVEKHIHEADFESLLQKAEQKGDTRQSVRLLYLWTLKVFSDRQVIQWNPDKTNIDYLDEIREPDLREEFRYLSYLFSYIWYGEFSIRDAEYNNAREVFLRHIKITRGNE